MMLQVENIKGILSQLLKIVCVVHSTNTAYKYDKVAKNLDINIGNNVKSKFDKQYFLHRVG